MANIDFEALILGEPIKTICRIKPSMNYLQEDLKIVGSNICIIDANNRGFFLWVWVLNSFLVHEEFDVREVSIKFRINNN